MPKRLRRRAAPHPPFPGQPLGLGRSEESGAGSHAGQGGRLDPRAAGRVSGNLREPIHAGMMTSIRSRPFLRYTRKSVSKLNTGLSGYISYMRTRQASANDMGTLR